MKKLTSLLTSLFCLTVITYSQNDSATVKVPVGTSTALTSYAKTTTTDSMRTNIYAALNGKQASGSYATLTGAEVITGKTLGMFNYAADAQANDSYVISLSPAPAAYSVGMVVIFKANTANTTGCSINVNGLGAKNIVKRVNTTLATGDILAGMFCYLVYDGTNFVILNPVVN